MRRRCAIAVIVAGCGGSEGGGGGVEEGVRRGLARELGVEVGEVRCPAGALPKVCRARIGEAAIDVRVADASDGIAWEVDGFVIATAPIEVAVGIELDELGIETTADCGPAYVVTEVGARIACALGTGGAAWARIIDDDGRFALEIAVDAAAAAARTAEIDDAELERRSRALDVAAANGTEAGAAAPAPDGGP